MCINISEKPSKVINNVNCYIYLPTPMSVLDQVVYRLHLH